MESSLKPVTGDDPNLYVVRERLFLPAIRVSTTRCERREERGKRPESIGRVELSYAFIKVARNVPDVCRDVASHNHICKVQEESMSRLCLSYDSAPLGRYVGRAFHADQSTEWATDSRLIETNKHYAKHSLNFIIFRAYLNVFLFKCIF